MLQDSLWKRGTRQLGNGLLIWIHEKGGTGNKHGFSFLYEILGGFGDGKRKFAGMAYEWCAWKGGWKLYINVSIKRLKK